MKQELLKRTVVASAVASMVVGSTALRAAPVTWTDWIPNNTTSTGPNFSANGTITTAAGTVNVNYSNAAGVHFYQANGGIDYWTPRNSSSPYTSAAVDNAPTSSDIIALRFAGLQSLTFSRTVSDLVFSVVSLNGNGYSFDHDFEILSFGNGSAGDACGFFGCGTLTKEVVTFGGQPQYRLIGSGEPHGTIRFLGQFEGLTWQSLANETWNGFTVGIQGVPTNEPSVPIPPSFALLGLGVLGLSRRLMNPSN